MPVSQVGFTFTAVYTSVLIRSRCHLSANSVVSDSTQIQHCRTILLLSAFCHRTRIPVARSSPVARRVSVTRRIHPCLCLSTTVCLFLDHRFFCMPRREDATDAAAALHTFSSRTTGQLAAPRSTEEECCCRYCPSSLLVCAICLPAVLSLQLVSNSGLSDSVWVHCPILLLSLICHGTRGAVTRPTYSSAFICLFVSLPQVLLKWY